MRAAALLDGMRDPAPKRQPSGIPVGGQFASNSTAEADLCLPDDDLIDTAVPDRARILPGQTAHHNIASGNDADDLATRLAVSEAWVRAGVTSPAEMRRLADSGISPEDFSDPDVHIRRWACAARGDLIFEGELLSNALQLRRHVPGLDPHRHFHHESSVYIGGEERRWNTLRPEDQLDYIRGYAQAAASRTDPATRPSDPGSFEAAGWLRGCAAVSAAELIDRGQAPSTSLVIVDPDAVGRRLVVRNARPAPERSGYTAEAAAGRRRYHHGQDYSRAVPWTEGTRVFFTDDALGAA